MKQDRNLIPKVGFALVVSFLTYGWIVADHGETGSPTELFGIPGAILMFAAILATFATMYVAARRAHNAGSWPWFVAVILIWPLSYVYALAVNRNG